MKNTYLLTRRLRHLVAGFTGLSAFIANPLSAGGEKPEMAVNIVGPVEVQGAVEVINDALKIPYNKGYSIFIAEGASHAAVNFPDIPTGKRLIIETMCAKLSLPAGQSGYVDFSVAGMGPNGQAFGVPIPVIPQGTYDGEAKQVGLHKVKIIIDSRISFTLHFGVSRTSNVGKASAYVSLHGYLEDIPAQSPQM